MSDMNLSKLVRELGIQAVPHGFRSSFRDWAAECSNAASEVCHLALAHVNSDRVEPELIGEKIQLSGGAGSWRNGANTFLVRLNASIPA